jgi:glycosyltransferase involved in cell wall biosynthesis
MVNNMPDGLPWPRISIVMPSYNQGKFIEETIWSVLQQDYPNLEYIIMDGGSNDESVEIIKKYENKLAHWVSQNDEGQSDAINQGMHLATGDLVAWINSDDTYLPGVFRKIATSFAQKEVQLVYGNANFINDRGEIIGEYPAAPLKSNWRRYRYWRGWPIPQPTVFMRRRLLEQYGYLDTSLHYALDYELLIRLSQHVKFEFLDAPLANYRIHSSSKTADWTKSQEFFFQEDLRVNLRYAPWYQIMNWPLWFEWIIHSLKNIIKQFIVPKRMAEK